jgi:hypothetical protein
MVIPVFRIGEKERGMGYNGCSEKSERIERKNFVQWKNM